MAIDALDIWIEEFKLLLFDPTGLQAPINITSFIEKRIQNKIELSTVKFDPGPIMIWMAEIFSNAIAPICVTPTIITAVPAAQFAAAWVQSVTASMNITITSGSTFFPTYGSNGIVGGVAAVIDAPSIQNGSNIIFNKLSNASFEDTTVFPAAFYEAFLALTVSITGIDTTPTPAGPLPIEIASIPVM